MRLPSDPAADPHRPFDPRLGTHKLWGDFAARHSAKAPDPRRDVASQSSRAMVFPVDGRATVPQTGAVISDVTYDELLDAVERLPIEKQEDLVTTVRERLAARGRERLLADVREAREYHAPGKDATRHG